jgi:hypothetical protein
VHTTGFYNNLYQVQPESNTPKVFGGQERQSA